MSGDRPPPDVAEPGPDAGPTRPSRLAGARSAYLRAAAGQAIDWHPWGAEPFALARRLGRPLLLDIGASWCHWCHVMDETTYSDEEVARLLRQHFIVVKVDRDEHPEIDRRYQRQVNAVSGEGGWPLTAFLTPDGDVFLGGTFFPPTDGHGRPGFRRVLGEVARLWREEPSRIASNAAEVRDAIQRMRASRPSSRGAGGPFVTGVVAAIRSSYDPGHAGFGTAPKFPHPSAVALLLRDGFPASPDRSLGAARATLLAMADGGIYDQIGGGFHRYSVDAGWHIPHFEKMAVDNAELLGVYVDASVRFGDPRFEEVVRGTARWSREVLGDPSGGWGASQDADNAPGDDGGYFTWSRSELKELLDPDELRYAVRVFGVGTDGRMPHDPDRNVLYRMMPPEEAAAALSLPGDPDARLGSVIGKLLRARAARPTPAVDRALYADLNGRFVGAFARAAAVIDDPTMLADARTAADRFLAAAYSPERGIAHQLTADGATGYGLLDDQVFFAAGLVDLAAATADPRYLGSARSLLTLIDQQFRGDDGLLRDLAPALYDGPPVGGVAEPTYSIEDSPHLSANGAAAVAYLRYGALAHDPEIEAKGAALTAALVARLGGAGLFGAGGALAARLVETPAVTVVVDGSGPSAAALLRAARRTFHPHAFVFAGLPPPAFGFQIRLPEPTAVARAFVCVGTSCGLPITDPGALSARIALGAPAG